MKRVEPTLVSKEAIEENVNHPQHYNSTIECIDAMEAMTENAAVDPHASYCWQAAFKYVWRWPYKENPVQDLKKAQWYLNRLIDLLEENQK